MAQQEGDHLWCAMSTKHHMIVKLRGLNGIDEQLPINLSCGTPGMVRSPMVHTE